VVKIAESHIFHAIPIATPQLVQVAPVAARCEILSASGTLIA
jgi:hypothetical protein